MGIRASAVSSLDAHRDVDLEATAIRLLPHRPRVTVSERAAAPEGAQQPPECACPASRAAGGRRSRLPSNALIELMLRRRLGTGVESTRPSITPQSGGPQ